jgi:hypothetical protein
MPPLYRKLPPMIRRQRALARCRTAVLLLAGALLATPSPSAEPPPPENPLCPATSLLSGLRPGVARPLPGNAARLTDGQIAPEGGVWDAPVAVRIEDLETVMTFDLETGRTLRSFLVQADANDSYLFEGSADGVGFARLAEVPALPGVHGLRTRALRIAPIHLRFLRLRLTGGDGRASISELQAYCVDPESWKPRLQVIESAVEAAAPGPGRRWNDKSSRWWELALALLGLGLLIADARRPRPAARSASGRRSPRARRWIFAAVAAVSVGTYFNFGAFHFGSFIHNWDTFHYYVGAKYFRELSYDRLYDCATVAEATREAGEPMARYAARNAQAAKRKIRNLRTNQLESTSQLLAHPEVCTARFTPERWNAFRHDVAWFRERESPGRWNELLGDHGFNATPVWSFAGSLLANLGPASDRQILLLCLIDPLFFAGMVALLFWGFGSAGAAVALLVLATDFPARFFWTGGAFLRWDWLFFTVAAVVCLRRERPFLGGAALAYAALLRIFPVFLAAGPLAILGVELFRELRSTPGPFASRLRAAFASATARPALRFFAGALVATVVLVPLSLVVNGGPQSYRSFLANTVKHQHTPLTNHMGLRTVVSFRPAEIGRHLVSDQVTEPWARWKVARLAAWDRSKGLAGCLALVALTLVAVAAARHRELWVGTALGAAFIPFAVELTSYYYAFLIVPALLWTVRREAGIALLLLSAFGLFVSLAPIDGMPTWRDEQYTLISLATLVALSFILWRFVRARPLFHRSSGPV